MEISPSGLNVEAFSTPCVSTQTPMVDVECAQVFEPGCGGFAQVLRRARDSLTTQLCCVPHSSVAARGLSKDGRCDVLKSVSPVREDAESMYEI